MKKILCLILCVCVIFGCTACINDSAAEKRDGTFKLNETATFRNLKFTATEIKESQGSLLFSPSEGKTFVAVKFTIENISDSEQFISSMLLFDVYADGVKCNYSMSAAGAFSDGMLNGSIAPGKKIEGWHAVEVPSDWKTLELSVQSSLLFSNPAKFEFSK